MQCPAKILNNGTRVKTHSVLESTQGLVVPLLYLHARRGDANGIITGAVPGHGGDVYRVRHHDNTEAVYCFSEFELEDPQTIADFLDQEM